MHPQNTEKTSFYNEGDLQKKQQAEMPVENRRYPLRPDECFTAEQQTTPPDIAIYLTSSAPLDVAHVRALRVEIRKMKNTLPSPSRSRYYSMIFTSLEKAAMWLGDLLSVQGEANPYTDTTVVPTQDDTKEVLQFPPNLKKSLQIKECRDRLGKMTDLLTNWTHIYQRDLSPTQQFKRVMSLTQAYVHLREARLDFGMELGSVLKEEEEVTPHKD